ncbi:spermidine synthase/peptidoglycan/LPS O-acetylase OafA/YrhL [Silvibacterium bohemicum]|uniref:Spermidine synthase/peptidoglycan/LPS O-acetylase OafA/YrhL n=1 Tax=Silvibacterium bohemicum TaxID=1577686 RepID=A0A841JVM1_9BACT|nr:fused MFS/spermidine synthase [Silvibacterium bohemicum]MBB6145396.1 spermidine synthase/peptidoglycan/LPS O-acetylase OafA/YrhL [Silvibacterium bohemicum]
MLQVFRSFRSLYGWTIFLGAFLLFAVEPMAAKQLLPALGGSSAVWITCLCFFQVALLLGYLYAHWLGRTRSARVAALLHIVLLALAAAMLALIHQPDLARAAGHPLTAIFATLSLTIGLPFLMLSATSPLLQLWLAREEDRDVPWRLFALSNAGSLLALALYPTVIERHLSLGRQRFTWSCGFVLYAILCGILAWRSRSAMPLDRAEPSVPEGASRSGLRQKILWFLLPAGAAMQLCAVTNHLSQNIAAIPLLWVLPLAVYLLTFIVAFEAPGLYRRWLVVRLLVVMLASLGYMLSKTDVSVPILLSIGFFLAELFFACLFCHAEAYRLRPSDPSEATLFYLLLAAGGAAGTIFIAIGCPLLFDANYDIALAFLATAALALAVTWQEGWAQRLLWSVGTALLLALVIMLHIVYARSTLVEERNFYGALRVRQSHYPPQAHTVRTLLHGTIEHGTQWFAPEFRRTPTTYYAPDSGIGLALHFCCDGRPRDIGVVGLGAGTLAAYGQAGDRIRFYEINPAVRPIAENLFTYLRDSPAKISFAPGDARLSLDVEPAENFDVLAIDAFSGDAIPLHLLTTEAMQIYRRQLAPGGILAFHVSNQYVDLTPEIAELAAAAGMQARVVDTPGNSARGEYRATWVLVTSNSAFLAQPQIAALAMDIHRKAEVTAWTDDNSSLLPLLQWRLPERF